MEAAYYEVYGIIIIIIIIIILLLLLLLLLLVISLFVHGLVKY